MNQCDCVLLIMNCKKYLHKAIKQKETWLKNFELMPYFHVVADKEKLMDKDYLFDFVNHILYVNTEDDYNSLPKKVIAAYKAVFYEFKIKYIFKTDDDQNLNDIKFLEKLNIFLLKKVPRIHYGGQILNVSESYISQYNKIHPELPINLKIMKTKYCTGRFYFLSDVAIIWLINNSKLIEKEYLEDYAIGYNLDNDLKDNMLNLDVSKYFTDFSEFN